MSLEVGGDLPERPLAAVHRIACQLFPGRGTVCRDVVNSSIGYFGDLVVISVPKGATFNITLSDTPNVRAPQQPEWNFSGANYVPVNPPPAPKPASSARKARAVLKAARQPAE